MAVSDQRLNELGQHYADLAADPTRKDRGYSDQQHVEIIDELRKLRAVVRYGTILNDPATIKAAADEIDCGSDCEHAWHEWDTNAGGCHKSEREGFCPFDIAETLRQLSIALYGPGVPSGFTPRKP